MLSHAQKYVTKVYQFYGATHFIHFKNISQFQKDYFIGKYALQKQKQIGVTKRLVMFHVEDIDPDKDIWPWGGEPIYRNNEFVGSVTSAGYTLLYRTNINSFDHFCDSFFF